MPESITVTHTYAAAGRSYLVNTAVNGNATTNLTYEPAAAKTGSLTTRTNNTDGTLTMTAGHGITSSSRIDLYWDGGRRRGVTVGTVATNSVPISGGSGDNLPLAATAITAQVAVFDAQTFTGNDVKFILFNGNGVNTQVVVADGSGTELLAVSLTPTAPVYAWDSSSGVTNPLAGVTAGRFYYTNGDSTTAARILGTFLSV